MITVIFPNDSSGKFTPSQLSPGCTYEVQGNAQAPVSSFASGSHSPFGSYPVPRCPPSNPMPHPSALKFQRRVVKKTILIANLSLRDINKPSSPKANRLAHTVVTQVIISLDSSAGECNVDTAAEMVKRQVGFEVVLLDSKLFPVIPNDSTSGPDFWKSTWKIIAASRLMYEKLTGFLLAIN